MATFDVPPVFEPSHCPTCQRLILAIRAAGLTHDENPSWVNRYTPRTPTSWPPVIEPCGHTIDNYTIRIGEITYVS